MARQLALPIEIVAAETVRDSSGLALSSRNGYLDDRQRIEAAQLSAALGKVAAALRAGRAERAVLEQEAMDDLTVRGWRPDYVAVRRADDLLEPAVGDRLVVLGAAALGGTRLIDNLEI
jgi:pantoate--beta-alanine ligase